MAQFLSFLAYWLLLMALIGGALLLVQLLRKKDPEGKEETVDPSTYKVIYPYDVNKKSQIEEIEKEKNKE